MCVPPKSLISFLPTLEKYSRTVQLQLHVHNENAFIEHAYQWKIVCVCVSEFVSAVFAMNVPNYGNIRQTFYKYQIECINEQ